MTDMKYDDLTPDQKNQIWHGKACGHPSNKPASETAARKFKWTVDEAGNVTGRISHSTLSQFF